MVGDVTIGETHLNVQVLVVNLSDPLSAAERFIILSDGTEITRLQLDSRRQGRRWFLSTFKLENNCTRNTEEHTWCRVIAILFSFYLFFLWCCERCDVFGIETWRVPRKMEISKTALFIHYSNVSSIMECHYKEVHTLLVHLSSSIHNVLLYLHLVCFLQNVYNRNYTQHSPSFCLCFSLSKSQMKM